MDIFGVTGWQETMFATWAQTQSLENSYKRVSRVLRVHEMKTMTCTALALGSGVARPRVKFLIVGERP